MQRDTLQIIRHDLATLFILILNMADDNRDANPDLNSPSQATIRRRRKPTWKKNVVKVKRNLGKEYVSTNTGKLVSERKIGPPCSCKKHCYDKVGDQNIKDIFDNYWASGDWMLQTSYIQKQVSLIYVKSKPKGSPSKQKTCTRIFNVLVMNEPIQVCKQAFVNMHGISRSRVDKALSKMTATGMPLPDLRGKHNAHPCIQESRILLAISHVNRCLQ